MKPNPLRRERILLLLFTIQFLSWSGMFCLWIFAVPVITQFILQTGGDGRAYHAGLIAVSACFALYALLAAVLAFSLPILLQRFKAGTIYGFALLIGAAGIGLLGIADTPWILVPAFVGIGVGWSAMSNLPYALAGAAAREGRGAYTLRLFGFSTVIPQIATTLLLAAVAAPIFGEALNRIMLVGCALMALGGCVALGARHRFDLPAESW